MHLEYVCLKKYMHKSKRMGNRDIFNAIRNGRQDVVLDFIHKGLNLNPCGKPTPPLHEAILRKNLPMVRLLISHGASVHCRNSLGETPLHKAAWSGRVDIIHELLRHGAKVNARDHMGRTPLYSATQRAYRPLILAGAKLTNYSILNKMQENLLVNPRQYPIQPWEIETRNTIVNALGRRSRAKAAVRKITTAFRKRKSNKLLSSKRLLGGIKVNMPQGLVNLPPNIIKKISSHVTPRKSSSNTKGTGRTPKQQQ